GRELELEERASFEEAGVPSVERGRALRAAPDVLQYSFESDALAELHRMPSAEVPELEPDEQRRRLTALSDRRSRLRALFGSVATTDATGFLDRLRARRRGDVLSERFHDMLHHAERRELLNILERAAAAPAVGPTSSGPTVQDVLRLSETVPTRGLPRDQA